MGLLASSLFAGHLENTREVFAYGVKAPLNVNTAHDVVFTVPHVAEIHHGELFVYITLYGFHKL